MFVSSFPCSSHPAPRLSHAVRIASASLWRVTISFSTLDSWTTRHDHVSTTCETTMVLGLLGQHWLAICSTPPSRNLNHEIRWHQQGFIPIFAYVMVLMVGMELAIWVNHPRINLESCGTGLHGCWNSSSSWSPTFHADHMGLSENGVWPQHFI